MELDHSYTLNNHTLERVHHHSYLGVLLSEDLKWASHVAHVTSSANQTLGLSDKILEQPQLNANPNFIVALLDQS